MNSNDAIRVLIADDHPVVREGLSVLINRRPDMTVVGQATNWQEVVEQLPHLRPDVSLLDWRMPGPDAASAIGSIRDRVPDTRIILLTAYDEDEEIFQGLRLGARGYLLKDIPREELIQAILAVHSGETFIPPAVAAKLANRLAEPELSAREMDVLRLLVQGKANKDIAATLRVSNATVKAHMNHILRKLKAKSRSEAIALAVKRGLVRLQ